MAKKKKEDVMSHMQKALYLGGVTQVALIEILLEKKLISNKEYKDKVNKILNTTGGKVTPIVEKIDTSYIG